MANTTTKKQSREINQNSRKSESTIINCHLSHQTTTTRNVPVMAHEAAMSLSNMDIMPGESFPDHFNIKEKIGRGAFGSVWIAEYTKTPEIEVAVKVIDRKYV